MAGGLVSAITIYIPSIISTFQFLARLNPTGSFLTESPQELVFLTLLFLNIIFQFYKLMFVKLLILVHGLLCCKNGCGYWNRDVNGATNIYKIAYNVINNKERPNYLSRSNNLSGFLEEFPKPKFTRSVKSKPF